MGGGRGLCRCNPVPTASTRQLWKERHGAETHGIAKNSVGKREVHVGACSVTGRTYSSRGQEGCGQEYVQGAGLRGQVQGPGVRLGVLVPTVLDASARGQRAAAPLLPTPRAHTAPAI